MGNAYLPVRITLKIAKMMMQDVSSVWSVVSKGLSPFALCPLSPSYFSSTPEHPATLERSPHVAHTLGPFHVLLCCLALSACYSFLHFLLGFCPSLFP